MKTLQGFLRLAQGVTLGALLLGSTGAWADKPDLKTEDQHHDDIGDGCGTVLTKEQADVVSYLQSIGAYDTGPIPRYFLDVPLTVHIVRFSNGTGGLTQAQVDQTIADANAHYVAAGVQFFQSGATRFINSDAFMLNIDTTAEINALKQTDVVPNTVNVYFTMNLAVEDGSDPDTLPDALCGHSSFTSMAVQGVAMANSCTSSGGNTSTFAHELGHYFDLFHTHETAMGAECPNGSNCATAGDLVCDTPADPRLDLPNMLNFGTCAYMGTGTRCGQPFNPDPTNLMSYAGDCRTHFTAGQNDRVLATLVNLRPNLLGGQLNVTWVNFYDDAGTGAYGDPFNNLPQAINATAPGGRIVFRPSAAAMTTTLNVPMTLDAFRGTATLGRNY